LALQKEEDALDMFGSFLMETLRDHAIDFYNGLAQGEWQSSRLQPLQAQLATWSAEQQEIARQCLIEAVDYALHRFLVRLEEIADDFAEVEEDLEGSDEEKREGPAECKGHLQVLVDGQDVTRLAENLRWGLFGEDGWVALYSRYPGG
jgi:hypothetical protein